MAVASASKDKLDQFESSERSTRSSPSGPGAKQDVDASSETSSSVQSGDTSERRDVDILTQVLSSRSEEYRLLFRLPPDEALVQDFNCALQDNFLLQGHLYLFIRHICFYSNIFGFETKKTIPFHELTFVRKAKTAAIFPNAIEIVAGKKKYFFGSFLSRDEAYRLIIDGWAQYGNGARVLLDHQESKSDNSCQENVMVTLGGTGSKQLADDSSSIDRTMDANKLEECRPSSDGINDTGRPAEISESQEKEEGNVDGVSSREPLTWQIEDIDAPEIPEHFTLVVEAKFPVHVEDFFSHFVSDGASDFLENFHRSCGDRDFRCSPWHQHKKFGHAREMSFLHPVNVYIGAKLGRCQEVQKFHVYKNSHLVIETSQQVSDVPYADYFHVEGIWDVVKNGKEENECILRVYFNVAFSKKTIFKGKIEQSTRDELREVYGIWINNARDLLKQKNAVKLEGVSGQSTGMIQDQEVLTESYSKLEGNSEKPNPTMSPLEIPLTLSDTENFDQQFDNPVQENLGNSTSLSSILRKLWGTLISNSKYQSHLPVFLAVTLVAILILMQISIIVLLTRVPEVHVLTQENHIDALGCYGSENIEWLEKRVDYLKKEMVMIGTRMESMRHEHAMLQAHLLSLERLKPRS